MPVAVRGATRASTLAPGDAGDTVWEAQRMVLDAGAQAARLRQQASVQAATICAAAEREAETVWQQASIQAAAIREASERDAAALRATIMKLSAGPAELVTATDSETMPVIRRAAGAAAMPVRRPQGPPRQLVAIRVAAAATAGLCLLAATAGTAELVLHGYAFFVFRSAGTGETSPNGLREDQGPGQPDAPTPAPSHTRSRGRRPATPAAGVIDRRS
jgi:hypothetical protein